MSHRSTLCWVVFTDVFSLSFHAVGIEDWRVVVSSNASSVTTLFFFNVSSANALACLSTLPTLPPVFQSSVHSLRSANLSNTYTVTHSATSPHTCYNHRRDHDEVDVDCGGATCLQRCPQGAFCEHDYDCDSFICVDHVCSQFSASDDVKGLVVAVVVVVICIVVVGVVGVWVLLRQKRVLPKVPKKTERVVKEKAASSNTTVKENPLTKSVRPIINVVGRRDMEMEVIARDKEEERRERSYRRKHKQAR